MSKHKKVVSVIVSLPGEEWKPVVGYEGLYSVSNLGRVAGHCGSRWRNQPRVMSPGLKQNGYLKVSIGPKYESENRYIHRLVLQHFGPPAGGKTDVNHIDGNKLNNRIENLEWATRSENMQHAMRTGLWTSLGARNPMAKITPDDVRAIRLLYSPHKRNAREVAERFSISPASVTGIYRGDRWAHVA